MEEKIINGVLSVIKKKGFRFTMDDVAKETAMSKKTIYTVFADKNELLFATTDYLFDGIKKCEQEVIENESLTTVEKLRKILCVLPEGYGSMDFRKLYEYRDKYPQIYKEVQHRLETGWEGTIELLQKGMEEGSIREISIPLFKLMYEATLEQFLSRDTLQKEGISYQQALDEIVGFMMDGITTA